MRLSRIDDGYLTPCTINHPILTYPTHKDTKRLVFLKETVEKARKTDAPKLLDAVADASKDLEFLMSNATVSKAEIEDNSLLFVWPGKLEDAFEKHVTLIRTAREKREDALKQQRIELNEYLETLKQEVAEFDNWGDIDKVDQYNESAQALKAKLEDCTRNIEDINEQEEAFEWDITQYVSIHFRTLLHAFCVLVVMSFLIGLEYSTWYDHHFF